MKSAILGGLILFAAFVTNHAKAATGQAEAVTITFVGDIMLDGGPGHLVTNQIDPFAHVAPFLLESDITIGNLECAITRKGHAQDKTYTFKGPLDSLPFIKKYFTAVSIANNHAVDWGKDGFADELTLLEESRIAWFGGGRNERESRRALVFTVRGRTIALLAYNGYPPRSFAATANEPGTAWLIEKNVIEDLKNTRQRAHADLVLLYLHWGEELEETPTAQQVELARRLIDAGADAIIGSHPHVTQTIEWYRERPIVYSLGNFMFDYFPHDPLIWTSYILQLTYTEASAPRLRTIPIELDPAGVPHVIVAR